jgi:hypothetical protein
MHILIVLFQIQRTIVFQKTSDECIDSCFDNILHLIIIKYWKTCIVASHAYCLVVESGEKKEYLFKIICSLNKQYIKSTNTSKRLLMNA